MSTEYINSMNQASVQSIISDLDHGSINLDIEYQREIVWSDDKQAFFIQSLLKGIAPNPIILNIDEEGNKQCIDGKQRLTSILRFRENKFTVKLNDQYMYYNDPTKSSLSRRQKRDFDSFKLFIVEYNELNYSQQLDIFGRIQHGAPLEHGETLLTQINDPEKSRLYIEVCSCIAPKIENKICTSNQLKRRKHYKIILEIAYLIQNGISSLEPRKLDTFLKEKSEDKEVFVSMLKQTQDILSNCFQEHFLKSETLTTKINKNMWLMSIYTYFKHPDVNPIQIIQRMLANYHDKIFGSKCDMDTLSNIYTYLYKDIL